jgi:hypothetical protein
MTTSKVSFGSSAQIIVVAGAQARTGTVVPGSGLIDLKVISPVTVGGVFAAGDGSDGCVGVATRPVPSHPVRDASAMSAIPRCRAHLMRPPHCCGPEFREQSFFRSNRNRTTGLYRSVQEPGTCIDVEVMTTAVPRISTWAIWLGESLLLQIAAIVESSGSAFAAPTEFVYMREGAMDRDAAAPSSSFS